MLGNIQSFTADYFKAMSEWCASISYTANHYSNFIAIRDKYFIVDKNDYHLI